MKCSLFFASWERPLKTPNRSGMLVIAEISLVSHDATFFLFFLRRERQLGWLVCLCARGIGKPPRAKYSGLPMCLCVSYEAHGGWRSRDTRREDERKRGQGIRKRKGERRRKKNREGGGLT